MINSIPPDPLSADGLWHNLRLLDTDALLRGELAAPAGVIAVQSGHIVYAGTPDGLPPELLTRGPRHDGAGTLVTPGLIDCTPTSSTAASARMSSRCGSTAPATSRSRAPAAASSAP